jgi:hypothetical protein
MKIGRNDPCPCGSGKKYKKCCYQKNNRVEMSTDPKEDNFNEFEDNILNSSENIDDSAFLLQAITNLRRITLDQKSHIKEYYKIRKMHKKVVDTMINYHQADKFDLKIDDNIGNMKTKVNIMEKLNLIETGFNLATREGAQGFYDLLIYKSSPNMNCITEDFIKSRRYRKPEKVEFLNSMLNSRLGFFEITKTERTEGYVYFKDIFTEEEHKIVDIALSGDTNSNDIYLYTRLIKYHDIVFSTGLNLVFRKKDTFIKKFILNHKTNYKSEGELLRFKELYNYFSNNPNKMEIFTNAIK